MWNKMIELVITKQKNIFVILFIGVLIWTAQGYDRREKEYVAHDEEYHKIISDNTRVMQDNTRIMQEMQKTNEGFKNIIEIKLTQIEGILNNRK